MITSILLAWALLGQAEAPATATATQAQAVDASAVRQLLRNLDAREKQERDEAEKALIELGPAVLDLLPAADARTSAEVTMRLQRIRQRLELARAEAIAAATSVSISNPSMPIDEIFKEIEKQTGNRIVDYREQFGQANDTPPLKVEFVETPFWEAFDKILDDAKLDIYPYADPENAKNALAIVERSSAQSKRYGAAIYKGAFRIACTEILSRRDLLRPDGSSMQISMQVAWEPRLRPIMMVHPLSSVRIVDDQNRTVPLDPDTISDITLDVDRSAAIVDLVIQAPLPARDAQGLSAVRGKLNVLLAGGIEQFEFAELEKKEPVTQKKAAATVVLERVVQNQELWEARIRIAYDQTMGAFASHMYWLANNNIHILSPDGERIEAGGMFQTIDNENEKGFAYIFDLPNGPAGHKLVYETPGTILSMPVEYELTNLELP